MEEMSFEPFFDYDTIDSEMIDDLHKAVCEYKHSARRFEAMKSKREAISVLKSQRQIQMTYEAIMGAIWTIPAMVHVADQKRVETHPTSGDEATVQRCSRCGSMLQLWHEQMMRIGDEGPEPVEFDDVPWWDEGAIVARVNHNGMMNLYPIEDRTLHHYEHQCVDIKGIVGTIFDEE